MNDMRNLIYNQSLGCEVHNKCEMVSKKLLSMILFIEVMNTNESQVGQLFEIKKCEPQMSHAMGEVSKP